MNLLIFVPAYNEQDSILKVAQDLRTHCPQIDFVVINDGSVDRTAQICAEKQYSVYFPSCKPGLTAYSRQAINTLSSMATTMPCPLTGDGQHNAKCVQLFDR